MDFKPTIKKVIASIIFTVILFWVPLFFIKDTSKILNIVNLSKIFSTMNIIIFIIEVIVLYILFSLFHKKKSKLIVMKEDQFKKMVQNNPGLVKK